MGIIQAIKRWWESLWQKEAQDKFGAETIESDTMKAALEDWVNIYQGKPSWALPDENGDIDIESFNFAKYLCSKTAGLTTLALEITVDGSERADWINGFMKSYIERMKEGECEKACAFGYIILKPNINGIDYVMPWEFIPTHATDGKIDEGIFFEHEEYGGKYYVRLEWHRFEKWAIPGTDKFTSYRITNKTYKSDEDGTIGKECDIEETPWAHIKPDAYASNTERPLFSVFKMPKSNNIDTTSPLGVSIFSNALKELKSLDIAWTRLKDEIFDSQKITFLGDMLIEEPGRPARSRISPGGAVDKTGKALPRHVRILPGSTTGDEYHEVNPTLHTQDRLSGIDHFLNLVGVKCGYSTGQFVLNGRTGHVTATQVEADEQETIQLIKQIRDSFQDATDGLIYALDRYADMYELAPLGTYEVNYDFKDITYNLEEDRMRHLQYVQRGMYPLWRYFVEFEGMSEEEAKEVVAEAESESGQDDGLFGEE